MSLQITTPIQLRFTDVDIFGHVNNVAQQMYLDLGKTELLAELRRLSATPDNVAAVVVSVQTDFHSQILPSESVTVLSQIEGFGTKSLTLKQQIVRGEEVCTTSRVVMVCFDMLLRQSIEVPEAWHKVLER